MNQGDDPARFELLGRIGAGNHGVVFKARDHHLGRDVAIKRFSHYLADDPRAMRRITREVETLARVQHPHVVTVHDLVHLPDGDGEVTPHLVMELVEGTSMRDLLSTYGPSPRSLWAVRGVLEGLAACHRAGIWHLDIKPANVLVAPSGAVKIVDFGIARAASDATATVAGTPHYMAPEQYDGRSDERSDVYAVGCVLYECVTGRPPFEGTMAVQLLAHRDAARPDPRAHAAWVGPRLAAVIDRAMAIDPDDRYPSVNAMLTALDDAAGEIGTGQPSAPSTATSAPGPVGSPQAARSSTLSRRDPSSTAPSPGTDGARADDRTAVVTRTGRLATFAVGLVLSAFVVALIPGLVWASLDLVPFSARPRFMVSTDAESWWMVAVGLALAWLILRRDEYFPALAGPEVGQPASDRLVPRRTRGAVRLAAGAALLGSVPMMLPWYLAALGAILVSVGQPWPISVVDTPIGLAWSLSPLVACVLLVRSVTRVRPRPGAVFASIAGIAMAGLAGLFFLVGMLVL